MDCGLFGVRFLFLGHKNGAVAPVDHLSTFATAPFLLRCGDKGYRNRQKQKKIEQINVWYFADNVIYYIIVKCKFRFDL